jgi:DNA-binding PadR family transcriptional regulator
MRHGHIHHAHHGRGGRHRARRGAIVNATLLLLDERPMHGYELMTELESRSDGRWRPSPGAMYPALGRMEEHGLVESEEIDGKKQFQLTDTGRQRLAEYRESRDDDAVDPWDDTGSGRRGDLRGHVAELVGQVRQIGRFGTPEQIERAAEVMNEAKRKLYGILATEPSADDAQDDDVDDVDG